MAYIVVRIRGTVNVPYWAETTLRLLNLEKKFRATIVPEEPVFLGMLRRVKNYVAWCKADKATVKELIEKKARKAGYKQLESDDLKKLGYKGADDLAGALADGKATLSKLELLKPWFALAPPRKGFKRGTKRMHGEKGVLGENEELPQLVRNMV